MVAAAPCATRRSFRDSLKVLEADIQHANTLASECSRDYDGACLQMRMSYSPAARLFLFLLQPRRRPRPPQDPHLQGVCGRHHHHVHPRKEGQHQGVLRRDIPLPHATGARDQRLRRPEAGGRGRCAPRGTGGETTTSRRTARGPSPRSTPRSTRSAGSAWSSTAGSCCPTAATTCASSATVNGEFFALQFSCHVQFTSTRANMFGLMRASEVA